MRPLRGANSSNNKLFLLQMMIANVAKDLHLLNSHVAWAQVALDAAKAERRSKAQIEKLKRIVNRGQLEHDEVK